MERRLHEWAKRTGVPAQDLVRGVVRERAAAAGAVVPAEGEVPPEVQARRQAALEEFARRMDALPIRDTRPADKILGYDEHGLPS